MRGASTAMTEAARAAVVRPFYAVSMDFPDGFVRMCSLDRPILIDGQTYYGAGVMGAISNIEEGSENRSYGFRLDLAGIPGNWSEYLRESKIQGRKVIVMIGFCDAAYKVLGTEVITVGRMDTQDVSVGKNTSVHVNCESIQVDWERARVRRCTDADHRYRYPTDGFFKYAAALENITLSWGK